MAEEGFTNKKQRVRKGETGDTAEHKFLKEEEMGDFELGMFPEGDPAFRAFTPGNYSVQIPSFTFDKRKSKEIGVYLGPIIDIDQEDED